MGVLSDLLAAVRSKAEAREFELGNEWADAVRRAAEGEELDPDRVVVLLEACDKTAEDFAAEVQATVHRAELQALVADRPNLIAARAEAQKRADAIAAEFKGIADKYNARILAEVGEVKRLDEQVSRTHAAESELLRLSIDSPDVQRRRRAISERRAEIDKRIRYLFDSTRQLELNQRDSLDNARDSRNSAARKAWEEKAAGYVEMIADNDRDRAALADENNRLIAQDKELDREVLGQ